MRNKEVLTHVGYKLILDPTEEQKALINKFFKIAIKIYNIGVKIQIDYYKENKQYMLYINKEFFKYIDSHEEYSWIRKQKIPTKMIEGILDDLLMTCRMCKPGKLESKSFNYSHQQFPLRKDAMRLYDNQLVFYNRTFKTPIKVSNIPYKLVGFGNETSVTFKGRHIDFCNPRIEFDGVHYYLAISIPEDIENNIVPNSCRKFRDNIEWQILPYSEPIGIDMGNKGHNWIVLSNGMRFQLPDFEKVDKQIARYQNILEKKRIVNDRKYELDKKQRPMTKGEIEAYTKLNKACQHKTNMRNQIAHNVAIYLLKLKPIRVVFETLDINGMIIRGNELPTDVKNHINKNIKDSALYTTMQIIYETLVRNGIEVIFADMYFPSTRLCSCCGNKYDIGRDDTYICPVCGMEKDRDLNAAQNLAKYDPVMFEMMRQLEYYQYMCLNTTPLVYFSGTKEISKVPLVGVYYPETELKKIPLVSFH